MNILTLIPSRGGSKAIPQKNIRGFMGKCLIDWTIDVAKLSNLDQIVVSTDCFITGKHCLNKGVNIIDRPKELATDKAPMLPVIKHAIMEMNSRNQCMPDAVCLLQPTNPLRTVETINKCIEVIEQGAKSVTTVYNGVHPKKSYYPNGEPVFPTNRPYDKRADKVLTRSGSVFITRTEYLLDNHLLWMPEFVVTDKIEAIDIDDFDDWYIAEALRMRMDNGD